jgi:hypothetical protein
MGLRNMEEGVPIPIYLTDLKNMEEGIQIPFVSKISPIQEKKSSIPKKRIRLPIVTVPEPSTHSILTDNEPQGIRFIMPEPSTHSIFTDNEPQRIRFNQSKSKQAINEEKPYATYIEKQSSIPKKRIRLPIVNVPEPSTHSIFTENEPQVIRFNQSKSKQAINEENPYATFIEKQSSIPTKERKKITQISKSELNKAEVLQELKKQQKESQLLNINELQFTPQKIAIPPSNVRSQLKSSRIPIRLLGPVSYKETENEEEKEKRREYQRKWRERNPDKVREYNAKSRANKKS